MDDLNSDLFAALEEIEDILVGTPNLEANLSAALRFLLEYTQQESGLVINNSRSADKPTYIASQLSKDWDEQLDRADSDLNTFLQEVFQSESVLQFEKLNVYGAVPLNTHHIRAGALLLYGDGEPSEHEKVFLEKVGKAFARAIWQAGAYQVELDRFVEIANIQTTSARHTLSAATDQVMEQILVSIQMVLQTQYVSLFSIDLNDPRIAQKKWLDPTSGRCITGHVTLEGSLVKQAIKTKAPIIQNKLDLAGKLVPEVDYVPGTEPPNLLSMPLIIGDQCVGAIQISGKLEGEFDLYDQQLLNLVGISIGNMVYTDKLVNELRIANADLEANRWQIQHSRNLLRTLFDSIPTSIYIIDRKWELVAVNKNRTLDSETHPRFIVGRRCYEALYNRTDICQDCRVNDTLSGGLDTFRAERRWLPDGEPVEKEITTYPIRDEKSGEIVQAIILEQDVTERSQMQNILAQSEKLAAVGQLAAGLAHEINNPLTAVIANAQILSRSLKRKKDLREAAELIEEAGERARQVLSNLLNLARRERYEFEPTDINETIQSSLDLLRHEMITRSVSLQFNPGDSLPLARTSPNHIQGVWLNLVMNAMDALEGQEGEITIKSSHSGDKIRVTVSDSGKGIPESEISQIFDPFFTTKAPNKGTGLGLSICHRTVKQHGGYIMVDSKPGEGTKFTVALPVSAG